MQSKRQTVLDPLAVARVPTQDRARARFDAVLTESEKLLEESGLQGFSIPTIAERLEMTRGSIYSYFPTPHAILNELANRHLDALETVLNERIGEFAALSWRDAIRRVVDYAVDYHNAHSVARTLILGGAVTDSSFRAQDMLMRRLGDLGRRIWANEQLSLPLEPDVATLVADIGLSCFRRSFLEHGYITPDYRQAAVLAMQGYLEHYEVPATSPIDSNVTTRKE
jgi:AcrR family transcriptional regulator